MTVIALPRLDNLRPTLHSTVFKTMEEAGELSRAVLQFLSAGPTDPRRAALLDEVATELLDVAQTCVTMIFVLEEKGLSIDRLLDVHLQKLQAKGYRFDAGGHYQLATHGNKKCLCLPRLHIPGVDLLTTVCKIQEELGELTQFLGKKAAASGETAGEDEKKVLTGAALELLDVAQCCFTMAYVLHDQYRVDLAAVVERHIAKLVHRGYCRAQRAAAPL